jgi:hypothetical protein
MGSTKPHSSKPAVQETPARAAPAAFLTGLRGRAASGGQRRGGVEERREVVGAHVAALEVGDRGGVPVQWTVIAW